MDRKDVISMIAALGFTIAFSQSFAATQPTPDASAKSEVATTRAVTQAKPMQINQQQKFVEKLALRAIGVDIT